MSEEKHLWDELRAAMGIEQVKPCRRFLLGERVEVSHCGSLRRDEHLSLMRLLTILVGHCS